MADNENGGALAPIDTEHGMDITIPPSLDPRTSTSPVWSSFKPTTDLEKARLLVTLTAQLPKLSSVFGKTLQVQNVAFQGVVLTDKETGEQFSAVRSIVYCADGTAFAAVSEGVRATLGMLMQLWGQPPWNPPLPLICSQIDTKGDRRYYILSYDLNAKRVQKPTGK